MKRSTRKFVAAAHEQAVALGVLHPVEAAGRLADGAPVLGPGQVYATPTGKVYHPGWCDVIGQTWDRKPTSVLVVMANDVGRRRPCWTCPVG